MARTVLIIGAVVVALISGLLVRNHLARQRAELERANASRTMVVEGLDVLVVSTDVEISGVVSSGQLVWQLWPKTKLHPRYILRETRPNAIQELAGSAARQAMFAGEPITAEKLIRKGEGGFLAAVLRPGRRAVTVKVDEATGLAGLILPGDRVDVILTREVLPEKPEDANKGRRFAGETIIQDLRVLAIDQTFKTEGDKAAKVGKTVTLEVNATQAESLMLAKTLGTVNLALRSSFGASVEDDRDQKFTLSDGVGGAGRAASGGGPGKPEPEPEPSPAAPAAPPAPPRRPVPSSPSTKGRLWRR